MFKLKLNNTRKVTLIDDEDVERVTKFSWWLSEHGYAQRRTRINGKNAVIFLHRFVMNAKKSDPQIDHRHENKLDNRKSELRFASPLINRVNRSKLAWNNRSGIRGVWWHQKTGMWRVGINLNYKQIYIGLFRSKKEALVARQQAELKYYGEMCPRKQNLNIKPI